MIPVDIKGHFLRNRLAQRFLKFDQSNYQRFHFKFPEYFSNLFLDLSKFFAKKSNNEKEYKIRRTITKDPRQLKDILNHPDFVAGFLTTGAETVDRLLFPMLYQVINGDRMTDKEIEEIIKNVKKGYVLAIQITKDEFDDKTKKTAEEGIAFFEENLNSVIAPYKI